MTNVIRYHRSLDRPRKILDLELFALGFEEVAHLVLQRAFDVNVDGVISIARFAPGMHEAALWAL